MKQICLLLLVAFFSCKTTRTVAPVGDAPAAVMPVLPRPAIDTHANKTSTATRTDPFMESLLRKQGGLLSMVADERDSLRVQVIYTRINRTSENRPIFTRYYFNVSNDQYFYPASVVKLPVALLALQRLNELRLPGLHSRTTMITESATPLQTAVFNDPTTPEGRPNINQYIRKIFLASDNNAFNRLYEFLGQQYINERMHAMGFPGADILHRLSVSLPEAENRRTNPVRFLGERGNTIYAQPMQVNTQPFPKRTETVGRGFMQEGRLIRQPMSFSDKNRLPLEDLTRMLQYVLFPESAPPASRFSLTAEDRQFVLQQLSALPGESRSPVYDTASVWDASGKFLLLGAAKTPVPPNIRIFNKVGGAYGFLTDVAYIADFEKNIEFMLSATIYCNKDGILNDDAYDYQSVGLPFMKSLGELFYNYEQKRGRLTEPDLSAFKLTY